jgi:DNA-binding GntR family transcriptional regulator
MHLDKRHSTPVYLQLKAMLQSQIEQGVYLAHQKLPSERTLCQHYSLSRMTARRALQALITDGLAYTQAGKGTFVGTKSEPPSHNTPFTDKLNSNKPDDIIQYYQSRLIEQLVSFNAQGIEKSINEALAVYSAETIASKLFGRIINQLEAEWLQGRVSLQVHNYAITTLYTYLAAMFKTTGGPVAGTHNRIVLACAPDDKHEIGLLTLALGLKQRGYQVIYLGSNFTVSDFHTVIQTATPAVVCFTAGTEESGETLTQLPAQCLDNLQLTTPIKKTKNNYKPLFVFGGIAFNKTPSLINRVPGIFLGQTIETALTYIGQILPAQTEAL